MASGTITLTRSGTSSGGKMYGQIVWSGTSNGSEANSSSVTATVQIKRQDGFSTTGTWKGSVTVGGSTKSISWYGTISNSWVTVATLTTTVNHNSNGSGTCYIYAKVNGPSGTTQSGVYVSGSETVTLDTIPRQAVMTSATNFNDDGNPTITYTNPLGSAAPSLQAGVSLTSASADVISWHNVDKTAGTDVIELTSSERTTLRKAVTSGNNRTVWIYLRTRIGETYYYSPMSKTLTIKNPEPTITPTIKDTDSATIALTGDSSKLIKYYSDAAITFGAAAVKEATIKSKKVTCGTKSRDTDGTISNVTSNKFVFTVTDSRGNTTTKTVTPTMVNYVKLTCILANNMPDTSGKMTVTINGNYFSGNFGATSNSLTVQYRYKKVGGSYSSWTTISSPTISGNTYSASVTVSDLDYQTSYVFQARSTDKLATSTTSEKTVKSAPVFDWGENDFNFNVPVTIMGNTVRAKRCGVGQDSNSDTNPWYKFASVAASDVNEDLRITFKVTFAYGVASRFGILSAKIRTHNSNGENPITKLEFESDTGIDPTNFVLAYSGTGPDAVFELWVKLTAYRFCLFEVLSESTRRTFVDRWTLYDQVSAGYKSSPTSGYTQVTATKPYLINNYTAGSVVIRYDTVSPASIYGGTWQRIEGRMLYGCASSGTVGATGTHTTGSGSSSLPYVNVAIWRRTE